jgi:biotin-dependent carboxylase-like uncharacterized protein
MSFKVIATNGYASFQDSGRPDAAQIGLSHSGAMDMMAVHLGNWLLGNNANAVAIEVILGGLTLEVISPVTIALTGANMQVSCNGVHLPCYQAIRLNTGDVLKFNLPKEGVFGYLCVMRGFIAPQIEGSASVCVRDHIGQPLTEGDSLSTNPSLVTESRYVPQSLLHREHPLVLRLLPTYQSEDFSESSKQQLFTQAYALSAACDRTGYRLHGDAIEHGMNTMTSEAMLPGAVQITPDGQPIVMMRDCPTIGGYPKIGTVFSLDLSKLAQLRPGQTIHFAPMSLAEARQKLALFNQAFALE